MLGIIFKIIKDILYNWCRICGILFWIFFVICLIVWGDDCLIMVGLDKIVYVNILNGFLKILIVLLWFVFDIWFSFYVIFINVILFVCNVMFKIIFSWSIFIFCVRFKV